MTIAKAPRPLPPHKNFRRTIRRVGPMVLLVALLLAPAREAAAASCTISTQTMMLGVYTGALSNTGNTSVFVTCTQGVAFSILLGFGNGSGATVTNRKVTGPSSNTLIYHMFRDSARTANWGQTTGTDTVNSTGTGSQQTFTIYPQLPSGQTGPPGSYTDSVLILVTGSGVSGSNSFNVTASISPSCTISATNLGFGTYIGIQLDATSTLSVTCTNTTPYNVGLSAGNANAATVTTRRMQGRDSNGLAYALFRDSARSLNWGNTVGTDTLAGTGSGSAQTLTVYGRIASGQRIAPAAYTDTIVVTLTY
jgi:spore coat protein U-like protein